MASPTGTQRSTRHYFGTHARPTAATKQQAQTPRSKRRKRKARSKRRSVTSGKRPVKHPQPWDQSPVTSCCDTFAFAIRGSAHDTDLDDGAPALIRERLCHACGRSWLTSERVLDPEAWD
jgi:hypothetical protein